MRDWYGENDLAPEQKINPLCVHIFDNRIMRSLEKPLKFQSYDGTGDPDEHFEHVDNQLDYYNAYGEIKCKLFALTLIVSTIT